MGRPGGLGSKIRSGPCAALARGMRGMPLRWPETHSEHMDVPIQKERVSVSTIAPLLLHTCTSFTPFLSPSTPRFYFAP